MASLGPKGSSAALARPLVQLQHASTFQLDASKQQKVAPKATPFAALGGVNKNPVAVTALNSYFAAIKKKAKLHCVVITKFATCLNSFATAYAKAIERKFASTI